MGFFSNRKSASVWKTGKNHADAGNFEKALVYFDDAARLTTDRKQLYDYRTWYYLTKALSCCKSGDLGDAKSSMVSAFLELQNFKDECEKTRSAITFNVYYRIMQEFMDKYDEYFKLIDRS